MQSKLVPALSVLLMIVAAVSLLWSRSINNDLDGKIAQMEKLRNLVPPEDQWAPDQVIMVNTNLKTVADLVFEKAPFVVDWSRKFYLSEEGSVHLYMMGKNQFRPMHLHSNVSEATVIVNGDAKVRSRYGDGNGAIAETVLEAIPGDFMSHPIKNGHEYSNPSADNYLATLVIATPTFIGNLYIRDDDAALLDGTKGETWHLSLMDPAIQSGNTPFTSKKIDALKNTLSEQMQISGEHKTVCKNVNVFYVTAGQGMLSGGQESVELKPGQLVMVTPGHEVTLLAKPGSPLAVLHVEFSPKPKTKA